MQFGNEPLEANHRGHRESRQAGFTLIEIMVVVVIIGILGALIVPAVVGRGDQARVTAAISDIRALDSALELYRIDNSHYPSTDQGLESLVERPIGFPEPINWNPDGYVKSLPNDPWGNAYEYRNDSSGYEIVSLGADGLEGGEGPQKDLTSADL